MCSRWTKEEDDRLTANWSLYETKEHLKLDWPNRSYSSCYSRASMLGLHRVRLSQQNTWSHSELELLRQHYPFDSQDEVMKFLPGRTWMTIQKRATMTGVSRPLSLNYNNVRRLLDDSFESWYWLGFILADGCFKGPRISIALSTDDQSHLQRFAEYVEANMGVEKDDTVCRVSAMDVKAVPMIMNMLGLEGESPLTKTYNPPKKLNELSDQALFAMFVGFIDGDGCIFNQVKRRKNGKNGAPATMRIVTHESWLPTYETWNDRLSTYIGSAWNYQLKTSQRFTKGFGKKKVYDSRNAEWTITNRTLREVKLLATSMGLPMLRRKWEKVDEYSMNLRDTKPKFYAQACHLFESGLNPNRVALQLGLWDTTVRKWHKEWLGHVSTASV